MKKLLFLGMILISSWLNAQDYYYYYDGKKVHLEPEQNAYCITAKRQVNFDNVVSQLQQRGAINITARRDNDAIFINTPSNLSKELVVNLCDNYAGALVVSPVFKSPDAITCWTTNEIIIQLNDNTPENDLNAFFARNNCYIVRNIGNRSNVLLASVNSTDGTETFRIANNLMESGLVESAEPNFNIQNRYHPYDSLFFNQWGVNCDTIDFRFPECYDIRVSPLWNNGIFGDPDVVVALLDHGVKRDHPDLVGNVLTGYDFMEDTIGANPNLNDSLESPGTGCAGIIAAKHNNIGIAGIAPACKILPMRVAWNNHFNSALLDDAIYAAVDSGAAIIQLSWSTLECNSVKTAIRYAICNGRNGKGCVVVASSGDRGRDTVLFPASCDGVISVGAIDKLGYLAGRQGYDGNWSGGWSQFPYLTEMEGSCYGEKLWVVAPGAALPSLSIFDDLLPLSGTSAASAHVAGAAALILSERPELTYDQVKNVIALTARKIRPNWFTYIDTCIHPMGSWSNKVGYGLIDAAAAFEMAMDLPQRDFYIKDDANDIGDESNTSGLTNISSPDIWLTDHSSGATVTTPTKGTTYDVHIRVNNRTDNTTFLIPGSVSVFWSVVKMNQKWNNSWVNAGTLCGLPKCGNIGNTDYTVKTIPAHGSVVLSRTFTTPSYGTSTCHTPISMPLTFVACVADSNLTFGLNESQWPIELFARWNNNVARRQYTMMDPNNPILPLFLSNNDNETGTFSVQYQPVSNKRGKNLNEVADVYITIPESLYNPWKEAGRQGRGFTEVDNNGKFKVVDDVLILDNIEIAGDDLQPLLVEAHFYAQQDGRADTFYFDVIQRDENNLESTIRCTAVYDPTKSFRAIAHDNQNAIAGEEVTFTAEPIGREVNYIWTNMSGDTLSEGMTLTTSASTTQRYSLQVQSVNDLYIDADTVTLTIKRGVITSIDPNPASNQVNINFNIESDISSPMLSLSTTTGQTLYNSSIQGTSHIISLQNIPSGHYYVRLYTSLGETLDIKSLIVK